ncbi:hypothetical protein JMUB6875_31040 [Nocardia sp. JMUB6875]|uniref:hypothetical protein n=1 Tax=Nocardia sp. JMUB6875 TaxID=3158170 RepID=UPI0032E70628
MTHYVIGFLRKDVSGESWRQDLTRIHAFANDRGWSMVLAYFGDPDAPGEIINRLMTLAYDKYITEVIAPTAAHFDPDDIPSLVKIADVICADTGRTTTRADYERSRPTTDTGVGMEWRGKLPK